MFAEAELDVLPEFLQLVLETMLGVLELLDPAVRPSELFFEPVDAQDLLGGRIGVAAGLARNVGRRLGLGRLRGLPAEKVKLGARRRNDRGASQTRRRQAQDSKTDQGRRPLHGFESAGPIRPADVGFKPAVPLQLAGAPLRTVTARRFCDQQEMSSQTATGRSLP